MNHFGSRKDQYSGTANVHFANTFNCPYQDETMVIFGQVTRREGLQIVVTNKESDGARDISRQWKIMLDDLIANHGRY